MATCTSTRNLSTHEALETLRRSLAGHQEPPVSDSKKARGAIAVFIKEGDDDLWLLMIKRSETPQDPWSGQMAFPGGHAAKQDSSLFDTAVRETQEEVGVDARTQQFLGCLDNVYPKNAPMIVSSFVFLLLNKVDPKTSKEAEEIVWVPVSFLLDPKNISTFVVTIRGEETPMPCYNYSDHIIWGMSFRIIREIISKMTVHS